MLIMTNGDRMLDSDVAPVNIRLWREGVGIVDLGYVSYRTSTLTPIPLRSVIEC